MLPLTLLTLLLGLHADPAPAPPSLADEIRQARELAAQQSTPEARWQAAHRGIKHAQDLRAAGISGWGELRRWWIVEMQSAGRAIDARAALDSAIADPENAGDLADACRLAAQADAGVDAAQATRLFLKAIQAYDSDAAAKSSLKSGYESCLLQVVPLLRQAGRTPEAIALNERVLGSERAGASPALVDSALGEKARLLENLGDTQGAIRCVDELLARRPTDPLNADWSLHRSKLQERSGQITASLETLKAIWDHPATTTPTAVRIGAALVERLDTARRADEALSTAHAIVLRINTLTPAERQTHDLDPVRTTMLSRLSAAHNAGRPDLAVFALRTLADEATRDIDRDDFRRQLAHAEAVLAVRAADRDAQSKR